MSKKLAVFGTMFAVLCVLAFGMQANAETKVVAKPVAAKTSTAPVHHSTKPVSATSAAKKGAKCSACPNVTALGAIEVKTEGNVKTAYLKVSESKTDDGKACCNSMTGKEVKLTGAKTADAEKLVGKQVEVKGACKAGSEINAASITEKK
jgi:hypothetical protein